MDQSSSKVLKMLRKSVAQAVRANIAFSALINILALAAPIYMLQIYDRVIPSRGFETLAALSILLIVAFSLSSFLDFTRAALFSRIASRLDKRVAVAAFDSALSADRGGLGTALSEIRTLRKFIASPALAAVFDTPWTPIFLAVIFLMHPALGVLAVVGGFVIALLAVSNQRNNAGSLRAAEEAAREAERMAGAYSRNVDAVDAMGMRPALRRRWARVYGHAIDDSRAAADGLGAYGSAIRTTRIALQSAILGLGAFLAINQAISPGVMIAASILAGRALAPIDQGISQWPNYVAARSAYARFRSVLEDMENRKKPTTRLPKARGIVSVEGLSASAPAENKSGTNDSPIISDISFDLKPGQALAILGPSASGKSTLARVLAGAWLASDGAARLDGADIGSLNEGYRSRNIGYLPQSVELFEGTVAENISRLAIKPDSDLIVRAAIDAGAHDLILRLPNGYDTDIGHGGVFLSGGQRQRIGLARALFGNPALVVLDEPNANLDAAGDAALSDAIRVRKERKKTTVLVTHRPSSLEHVTDILVMDEGRMRMYGPKEQAIAEQPKQRAISERKVRSIDVGRAESSAIGQ